MKIYGKTFLYFGSSLKTVLSWQGEEGKLEGTLERGIVLGDGFELLPHSLLCNLLKNRFQSIKCSPCRLTQKKRKSACLRSHKSCGFSANQHGLKHPLPEAHPCLISLASLLLSSHPRSLLSILNANSSAARNLARDSVELCCP